MFYKHPALKDVRYYWRVEPKVHFFCDIDYDVFRYMHDHNKTYGFTINLYDAPLSMPTLWPETERFMAAHPEYEHQNNAREWVVDSKRRPEHNMKANGFSTCHFWSNFEIADMEFWRSKPYEDYFEHLDRAGGFFYERWGDAPVHSIALGLMEDKSKLHWLGGSSFSSTQQAASRADVLRSGFEISDTSTYLTSIVPTHLNVKAALQVASRTENDFSSRRIADRIGSSMWVWTDTYTHNIARGRIREQWERRVKTSVRKPLTTFVQNFTICFQRHIDSAFVSAQVGKDLSFCILGSFEVYIQEHITQWIPIVPL